MRAFRQNRKEKRLQAQKFLCIIKTLWIFAQINHSFCDENKTADAAGKPVPDQHGDIVSLK